MRHAAWTALLIAVVLPAAAAAAAGADDRVAFLRFEPSSEILVVGADGTGETSIVRRDPSGATPAWSPDGETIAFTGWTSKATKSLWLMDRDGTDLRRVLGPCTSLCPEVSPDWSPDGRRLVVSFGGNIYVVRRNGRVVRRLTAGGAFDTDPAWSPTGKWIVFVRGYFTNARLYRIRPDGTGLRALGRGDTPDWSPDGRRIVFSVVNRKAVSHLLVMRADGRGRKLHVRNGWVPAWSPRGGRIAFARGSGLWTVKTDGAGLRRLAGDVFDPSWSPRGDRLLGVRTRFEEEWSTIIELTSDGRRIRRLLTPVLDSDLAVSPDGTRFAFTSLRPFARPDRSGVYVINADGRNESFVHAGSSPDWSPDGSRLLVDAGRTLVVIDPDGSSPTVLPAPVNSAGRTMRPDEPAWHPDGVNVSFVARPGDCGDVFLMAPDAPEATRLTGNACLPYVSEFDWAPDGATLVYSAWACDSCSRHLFSLALPGGAPVELTSLAGHSDGEPAVSPAGDRVAFTRQPDDFPTQWGPSSIFVMGIDGSGQTRIAFGAQDWSPAWLAAGPG